MNSSLITADRSTHWKVLMTAALAAAFVVLIVASAAGNRHLRPTAPADHITFGSN